MPESDALEQQDDVAPAGPEDDNSEDSQTALEYPERLPTEAAEADALEQIQTVRLDEDEAR